MMFKKKSFLQQNCCEIVCGGTIQDFHIMGGDTHKGAFYPPTLLYCAEPYTYRAVHETEAFGPVATLMTYQTTEQAVELVIMGEEALPEPSLRQRYLSLKRLFVIVLGHMGAC